MATSRQPPPNIHDGSDANKMCESLLRWITTWHRFRPPILDVGCRDMLPRLFFEKLLLRENLDLTLHRDYLGLDIIQYQVPLTVRADAHFLPFPEDSMGTIICFESLEHFRDPIQAVREWGRVLKPGGLVAVTTVERWPKHEEPEDHWRFKPRALEILLEASGLEVVTSFSKEGGIGIHSIAIAIKAEGVEVKPMDMDELRRNMSHI